MVAAGGPVGIVLVSDRVAHASFCGRTLVESHVETFRRCGVHATTVVDEEARIPRDRPALVVRAERIVDPRIYQAAIAAGRSVVLSDGPQPIGIELHVPGSVPTAIDIADLDPYSRELRRPLRPYWMRVEAESDRPRVRRLLIDASAKGHQELTSRVIETPIESAILARIADTRITPNQLTAICNVIAYAVAALYATGHFLLGALGAVAVAIADGLDGRQARIQLRTSTLGRLEHLLDKIYEILWIVALAYGLSAGFADRRFATGMEIWIAAYLLDTVAYDVFRLRRGMQLDEATPVDAAIRLVAGRRNIYTYMMLVGALARHPQAAFWSIVVWSALTAALHWIRVTVLLRDVTVLSPPCHPVHRSR